MLCVGLFIATLVILVECSIYQGRKHAMRKEKHDTNSWIWTGLIFGYQRRNLTFSRLITREKATGLPCGGFPYFSLVDCRMRQIFFVFLNHNEITHQFFPESVFILGNKGNATARSIDSPSCVLMLVFCVPHLPFLSEDNERSTFHNLQMYISKFFMFGCLAHFIVSQKGWDHFCENSFPSELALLLKTIVAYVETPGIVLVQDDGTDLGKLFSFRAFGSGQNKGSFSVFDLCVLNAKKEFGPIWTTERNVASSLSWYPQLICQDRGPSRCLTAKVSGRCLTSRWMRLTLPLHSSWICVPANHFTSGMHNAAGHGKIRKDSALYVFFVQVIRILNYPFIPGILNSSI